MTMNGGGGGSPGLVRRRIQEMTAAAASGRGGGRSASRSPSRSGITHINVTTSNHHNRLLEVPKWGQRASNNPAAAALKNGAGQDVFQRKVSPPSATTVAMLSAPRPFPGANHVARSVSAKESSYIQRNDKPPELLPKRSQSSLSSPPKPTVPPKPSRLSSSKIVTPPSTSPPAVVQDSRPSESQRKDHTKEIVETRGVCDSPLNTSFTKFNQKIQKFDMLKKRQSYSEFEELIEKKRELRQRMMAKIHMCREEQDLLLEEKKLNDSEGQRLLHCLESVANTSQVEKFRLFLEEIEQITKLTVSLTIRQSRLAKRIESGKLRSDMVEAEKRKENMLKEQSIEAETLHRNTDRRGVAVRKIVSAHLGEAETKAYDTFLDNLIRLVTDLKETEQRIQLGEEQLIHLNDNLVTPPQPASSSSVTSTP